MHRGDHPDLGRVLRAALTVAGALGHPGCGSEHLLLSLSARGDSLAALLGRHGATESAIRQAVRLAAPLGAGAAADRDAMAPIGIDMDRLLSGLGPAVLDRMPARERLLPLGAAAAREDCAQLPVPLRLDAQAAYQASLRLALARRDREHRPEHLAMILVSIDPGTGWVLRTAGVNAEALLNGLANAYPAPRCNLLLRAERRIGRDVRCDALLRRYRDTTGRLPTAGRAITSLVGG